MKHNIFDNGVLNYAEMKRVSYEGAISEAIRIVSKLIAKLLNRFRKSKA